MTGIVTTNVATETAVVVVETAATEKMPAVIHHGQGLRAVVEARRGELQARLAEIGAAPEGSPNAPAIEAALSALAGLATGGLDDVSDVIAGDLTRWIDTSKHLTT